MVVFSLRQMLADLKLPHDVNFVACVLLLKHKDNIVSLSMDQLSHNRKQDDQLTQGSRCVSVRSSHSDRTQNHLEYHDTTLLLGPGIHLGKNTITKY